MSRQLIKHIRAIVLAEETPRPLVRGAQMDELPILDHAFLLVENGRIADFGPMSRCPLRADEEIDARGGHLFPAWCDSHTHLVFAGSREGEFVDRIRGLSYEEIARRGGGILHSAKRLQHTPEDKLLDQSRQRLLEVQRLGTGAIEIKSGYGLTADAEWKMLRVIRRLREESSIPVRATFLGAHALPPEFTGNREGYIRLLIDDLLPRIAGEGLADYLDVFCERGFFSVGETDRLMEAGLRYGIRPKIHTNQFTSSGGIAAAIRRQALSVDHLEVLNEEEIALLQNSATIPTLLPSAPFFLNDHYPPARKMIDAGLAVALASDYNPGSSPSGRMALVVALACIKLRMTPAEAVQAATLNGAYAMELQADYGSIARGKVANFFITRPIPSVDYLPYAFGSNLVERVCLAGKWG